MITAKWLFKWKANRYERLVKAKTALAARVFRQREGVNYFENFAETPAMSCTLLLRITSS